MSGQVRRPPGVAPGTLRMRESLDAVQVQLKRPGIPRWLELLRWGLGVAGLFGLPLWLALASDGETHIRLLWGLPALFSAVLLIPVGIGLEGLGALLDRLPAVRVDLEIGAAGLGWAGRFVPYEHLLLTRERSSDEQWATLWATHLEDGALMPIGSGSVEEVDWVDARIEEQIAARLVMPDASPEAKAQLDRLRSGAGAHAE